MADTVTVGQYLVVPFIFDERRVTINEQILDGLARLPVVPVPGEALEHKIAIATFLTDPNNLVWEVWRGGQLVGILSLSRIARGLDAVGHFAFFDRRLAGRQAVIRTMIRWAFEHLGLQRLSVEIPEGYWPLVHFAKSKLNFRYEGEGQPDEKGTVVGERRAQLGARRERCFWDGRRWRDLALLRLLREEAIPGG